MGNTLFLWSSMWSGCYFSCSNFQVSNTVTLWDSTTITRLKQIPETHTRQNASKSKAWCYSLVMQTGELRDCHCFSLVTKTSALKIQSGLKLSRQRNPCPQQEQIVKSKPTKNLKARNEPKVQGCIRTCVCVHWREKQWRVTDRREKLQEQLPRYQGKI